MTVLGLLVACQGARSFDGIDDYSVVPDPGGLDGDAVTVEAWVWPDEGGAERQDLVARRSPAGGEDSFTFRLRQDWGGVLELGLAAGRREWGTAGKRAVPRAAWTFVAFTHDRRARQVCLYVAAELDTCDTARIPPGTAPDMALWLGGDPLHGPTGRPFKGRLRDVRIWRSVRTPAEVRADAEVGPAAGAPDLAWAGP